MYKKPPCSCLESNKMSKRQHPLCLLSVNRWHRSNCKQKLFKQFSIYISTSFTSHSSKLPPTVHREKEQSLLWNWDFSQEFRAKGPRWLPWSFPAWAAQCQRWHRVVQTQSGLWRCDLGGPSVFQPEVWWIGSTLSAHPNFHREGLWEPWMQRLCKLLGFQRCPPCFGSHILGCQWEDRCCQQFEDFHLRQEPAMLCFQTVLRSEAKSEEHFVSLGDDGGVFTFQLSPRSQCSVTIYIISATKSNLLSPTWWKKKKA